MQCSLNGLALEKRSSVMIGQSLSDGSKYRACIPCTFKDAAKIRALVLSPMARISSRSVSTIPDSPLVRSNRASVVLPTALTITTTLSPAEYSRLTDSAARFIRREFARLEPPNFRIIGLLPEADLRFRMGPCLSASETGGSLIVLAADVGGRDSSMPVKMTTHRLHQR